MMPIEFDLAVQYRTHAKALRAAASFDRDAETSMTLTQIADQYDQMAEALEGIHHTNRTTRIRRM